MKIVCLGWGSLTWNCGNLPTKGNWHQGGPHLPIEFARQSEDGRITLVIIEGVPKNPTQWIELNASSVPEAIDQLAKRECTYAKNIGYVEGEESSDHTASKTIADWAHENSFQAVIWTGLGPKFCGEDGRIPTEEDVIAYLRALKGKKRKKAERSEERRVGKECRL